MALNIYADAACDYLRLIIKLNNTYVQYFNEEYCDESRLLKPVILATHSNIVIHDSTLDPTILNTDNCDENNNRWKYYNLTSPYISMSSGSSASGDSGSNNNSTTGQQRESDSYRWF
ncbi:hypothetical protein JG688_00002696 [Phytophthora aleatoria]|uniref:Uncharacterized protein n=1 Tax=Phytophthora aleatoria TaxID=2496075 RepID=A0A8J5M8J4_9STRA|nr:hypothetical protein JG688_00002696 [Phytophthora aleatoria]